MPKGLYNSFSLIYSPYLSNLQLEVLDNLPLDVDANLHIYQRQLHHLISKPCPCSMDYSHANQLTITLRPVSPLFLLSLLLSSSPS
jgi:hypothetical protein